MSIVDACGNEMRIPDNASLLEQLASWLRLPCRGTSRPGLFMIEGEEPMPPDGVVMRTREVVSWTPEGLCRYQLWYLPQDCEPMMAVEATFGGQQAAPVVGP